MPKVVDDGVAYVILQTNGVASAQIQFKAVHHEVTVSSVGIIDGTVTRPVLGRRAYVDFRNFLPYGSIRGGRNAVQFAVMEYGGLRLVGAIFLPGTKLHVDSHAPAKATLDIRLAPNRVAVGETTEARFRVTNTGGSPLSYVWISATYPRSRLRAQGPTSHRFRGIPSGGTRHGVFRFTALTPGVTQIYLSAHTNSNRPIEAATLVVTKAS